MTLIENLNTAAGILENIGKDTPANHVRKAATELERLEKDKERLDWLEKQELRQMKENRNAAPFLVWYPWINTAWGENYRLAIDSAIQQEKVI